MIQRWTAWRDERFGVVQVSLAILDDHWEPLAEWTEELGPFDDAADVVAVLRSFLTEWRAVVGEQLHLVDLGPLRPHPHVTRARQGCRPAAGAATQGPPPEPSEPSIGQPEPPLGMPAGAGQDGRDDAHGDPTLF